MKRDDEYFSGSQSMFIFDQYQSITIIYDDIINWRTLRCNYNSFVCIVY